MQTVRTFYVITLTQIFSLIGSRMTSVAIGIWLYTRTGDSSPVLLVTFFSVLPQALAGSIAGVFADRWSRRTALLLSDAGQAVGTVLLLLSFASGQFQLWHLYVIAFAQGVLRMVQEPAMAASITMLVPETHRDRANALRQMSGPLAGVIAPVLAAFLFAWIGIAGIIVIDLLTFACAAVTLWLTRIPDPPPQSEKTSALQDAKIGIRFLLERRVLLFMMVYAAVLNFLLEGPINLSTPYIMELTGSEQLLGILLGCLNLGVVMGGIFAFLWKGTRPRMHGIMLGLLFRAFWLMVYGVARTPLALGVALFFLLFTNVLVNGSLMSIMQLKVPPHMQGRIFALLFQMMYIANPLSLLLTGLLADNIFEPAVGTESWARVAPLVGSVPGSGMGLLIFGSGLLIFILTLAVYAYPRTRRMEAEMPDYVAAANG